MTTIKTTLPLHCHLWTKETLTREEIVSSLELVETYEDDSHEIRKLLKCKQCGQLYFYEFLEHIDWVAGNDAMYRQWIPVDHQESAKLLAQESSMELLNYPAIRVDFPSDAKEATKPYRTQ